MRIKLQKSAVLFADVAGFSLSLSENGKAAVRELLACRKLFADIAVRHRGRLVDQAGDSILAWFDCTPDALACAVAFATKMHGRPTAQKRAASLQYRIGISCGTVMRRDREVFGGAVIEAARICAAIEPHEIGLTAEARSGLAPGFEDWQWRQVSSFIKEHEGACRGFAFDPRCGAGQPLPDVDRLDGGPRVRITARMGQPGRGQSPAHMMASAIADRLYAQRMNVRLDCDEDGRTFPGADDYVVICEAASHDAGALLRAVAVFTPASTVIGAASRQVSGGAHLIAACESIAAAATDAILRHFCQDLLAFKSAPKSLFQLVSGAAQQLRAITPDTTQTAIRLLHNALELQPRHSRALGTLARAYSIAWRFDWNCSVDDPLAASYGLAVEARDRSPEDFRCLADFGFCAMWSRAQDEAIAAYDAAAERASWDAELTADRAMALSGAGWKSQSLELLRDSLLRDPYDPDSRLWSLADVLFSAGQYHDAQGVLARMTNSMQASRLKAACAVRTGSDPAPAVRDTLASQPNFSVSRWAAIQPPSPGDEIGDFADALRQAGLPQ